MNEEYNYNRNSDNTDQNSGQNFNQNYNQNHYQYDSSQYGGYQNQGNSGYEPPRKKSGLGKMLILTLGLVLLVGVAAVGGYSVRTIVSQLTGSREDVQAEEESQKVSLALSDLQGNLSVGQSGSGSVILTDVSDVVEQAMPTVVAITNSSYYNGGFGFWGTTQIPTESSGSGIIIGQNDKELLIVTNNHVIEGNDSLTVQFVDGTVAAAVVKGASSAVDIAIIAVNLSDLNAVTKDAIAIAAIGDSDSLRMGQGVIAIGNAMGYGQSVTTGCISALNRQVTTDEGTTLKVLQTDAAINPGNSGGALLNQNGEVIGINTAKLVDNTAEGIGYAIPITSVVDLINDMMNWETREKVSDEDSSYLGIQYSISVDPQSSQAYGMPIGVYVYDVQKNTPADKAGLLKGDIITGLDRYTIADSVDLQEALSYFPGGETVTVVIQRLNGGQYEEIRLDVTLGYKRDYANQ